MKKKVLSLFCGLFIATTSFADDVCKNEFMTLKCGPGVVSDISFTGIVDAKEIKVLNMVNVLGSMTANNVIFNNVVIKGEAHFLNTNINGELQMIGNINAKEIHLNKKANIIGNFVTNHTILEDTANIVGMIDCQYCVFKKDTNIIGDIILENSEFLNKLTINTKKATFKSTNLNDLFVMKQSEDVEQRIYLNNGSKVRNITFENQKGIVFLGENSQVTGYVQGGKVIKN